MSVKWAETISEVKCQLLKRSARSLIYMYYIWRTRLSEMKAILFWNALTMITLTSLWINAGKLKGICVTSVKITLTHLKIVIFQLMKYIIEQCEQLCWKYWKHFFMRKRSGATLCIVFSQSSKSHFVLIPSRTLGNIKGDGILHYGFFFNR